MTLKTIYIARHGFRLNWQTTIWKSPTGFPRDPPLASYGDEQAAEMAAYMASLPEDQKPTAIYCSPYYRCLQTVAPTARTLCLPIFVEHGLAEWYSPVKPGTGLHPAPVPADKLLSFFDEVLDPSYTPTFLVSRKGESVPELYKRGEDFLKAFIRRVEDTTTSERILLMSHAATVITLSQALLGDESIGKTLRVGCCTLSTFDRVSSASNSALLGEAIWNARGNLAVADFLTNGVERDWGMADIEVKDGVVIEDDGIPGTEGEEDVAFGVQPWEVRGRGVSRM